MSSLYFSTLSPYLSIDRLVVEGELHCDISFTRGLNVIQASSDDPRATNNAGKSTLVELIQHGLGKKQDTKATWYLNPIIDQVNTLYLEIGANNKTYTIERSLRNITAAVTVRNTSYSKEIKDVVGQKITIDDLSDWFLSILNIPKVAVSTAKGKLETLSFPLLMRTFVLNQNLSFAAILNKVPDARIPDIIGFLTGIIPLMRYKLEERLAIAKSEEQRLDAYYKSINKFLIDNSGISTKNLDEQLITAKDNLTFAKDEQLIIQRNISEQIHDQPAVQKSGRIDSLRDQMLELKQEIANSERYMSGVEQEQIRLKDLLNSLKTDRKKVLRLKTSSFILNSVNFGACPRCLQPITSEMIIKEDHGRCCLCSRPLTTTSDAIPKTAPRAEDIDLQIEEVETVLRDVSEEREILRTNLNALYNSATDTGASLNVETKAFISPNVDLLLGYAYKIAHAEAELARIQALYDQVQAMNNIYTDLNEARIERKAIEFELKQVRKANNEHLEVFRHVFEDILRDVDFPDLQSCNIDPQKFIPTINNNFYKSFGGAYTSLVVVCYHLAILELALREETFFPSLLVIDSPNVNDMNETTENNLLHYLVNLATEHNSDKSKNWQIILTTRRMVDELDPFVRAKISKQPNQMLLHR